MTDFNQGDVVLIPFPFTDLSTTKQRPALIVSSDRFNRQHNDVIVMAITSQIPPRISADEYLLSPADQLASGLPKKSMAKSGKITTISQKLIHKKLGNLPESTVSLILEKFVRVLGVKS